MENFHQNPIPDYRLVGPILQLSFHDNPSFPSPTILQKALDILPKTLLQTLKGIAEIIRGELISQVQHVTITTLSHFINSKQELFQHLLFSFKPIFITYSRNLEEFNQFFQDNHQEFNEYIRSMSQEDIEAHIGNAIYDFLRIIDVNPNWPSHTIYHIFCYYIILIYFLYDKNQSSTISKELISEIATRIHEVAIFPTPGNYAALQALLRFTKSIPSIQKIYINAESSAVFVQVDTELPIAEMMSLQNLKMEVQPLVLDELSVTFSNGLLIEPLPSMHIIYENTQHASIHEISQ